MSKKILFATLVLAFTLALSLFVCAREISTPNEMLELMNGILPWDDDYVLTESIDLSKATNGYPQAPIGIDGTPFTGTFDGGNNYIKGIDINGGAKTGLFGFAANATIKNLTIYGTVSANGNAVGGFVGHVDTAAVTLENCINYCTVTGGNGVGGIIGRVETNSSVVTINKCINYGTINGTQYVAGIAGFHSQTNGATTIENCINDGTINATTGYAGGICGYWRTYNGATNKCFVQDCLNKGSVTVTGSTGYAGGIIGYGSNRNYKYTITRCLNMGAISASKFCRPVAATVSETTNTAGQFNNCYYTSTDTYTADSYGVEIYVADFTNAAAFAGLGENWILVDGRAPELKVLHTHDYKYVVAGEEHNFVCYCGKVALTEAHSFVDGVCDKCGAEDVPCPHENKYEVVETAATCVTVGTKYEFCPDCNAKVSEDIEIPLDENNHVGALTMASANGAVTFTCACGAVVYTDSTLLDTVYVSENGLELVGNVANIGTEAVPFKNFTDAMQYAAYCGKDVTVRILDTAYVPKTYVTPAFDATVTVTGGTLKTANRFVMNGKFVFEHIKINPTETIVMAAKEHKLVMGEGITHSGGSIYLVGGYENGTCSNSNITATGYTTDITIRSGVYGAVGGANRYLSGAYSGTINMTIGKTNPNDVLEITSTFAVASMNYEGGNNVKATLLIDGPVDNINSFCPITHAKDGTDGRFDVDIVVQGATTTKEEALYYRGSNYTVAVYADERVDGVMGFASIVALGEENVQPYSRYCLKVNGEHPDAAEDGTCDNCGAPTACEHEYGEWRETAAANCVSAEKYVWYCFDCKEAISDMTKDGDAVDATNHISENFAWQKADGKYFFGCTACGAVTEQENAPTVYVSANGSNALDGTSREKALATVEEAVTRIANVGGTVVICGEYALSENLTLPAYAEEITVSGFDNAGEYGSFYISKNVVITLGGATKFDKIGFGGSAVYTFVSAWNDTVFGTVQPYGTATAYLILGYNGITNDDTDASNATLTITEGTSQRHTSAGTRYVDRFYAYIYLGDTFGAEGVTVANKTATLNATNADIGILYTMSTSAKYKNAPVTACETTVNLYGATKVDKGRTGDYNVGYAESTACLDKQTINFFDNSYIGSNYLIRNAKETVINVSTEVDGRTVAIRCPIAFYAFGTFASEGIAMNVTANYGTHSFSSVVESPCTFTTAANALKVYGENKTNECVYTAKVTAPATPTAKGTVLYSCACGRTYTEQYDYSCNDVTHLYIAKANGTFECTVCDGVFDAVNGENVFALAPVAIIDGKATVTLRINGSFAAALVKVTAPAGFALDAVTLPEVYGFTLMNVDGDITLVSNNGVQAVADFAIALTYTFGENASQLGVFEVAVPELYGTDMDVIVATTVGAEIVASDVVAVAQIGNVKYATLADAFAAAQEGDTIVALEKITVTGTEIWNLAGKTLVFAEVEGNYALVVKGNLTIEGGNFVSNGEYGIGVTGTLTVNGGTFTSEHPESYIIGTWGNTTINGGTFKSVYNNVNAFAGTLVINGGDFSIAGYAGEYESADVLGEENTVTVYGGTFSTDPTDFVANGYLATENGGIWGVEIVPPVSGDVDGDSLITVLDALIILKAMLNETALENADVSGDGAITLLDVIKVFKMIVK